MALAVHYGSVRAIVSCLARIWNPWVPAGADMDGFH